MQTAFHPILISPPPLTPPACLQLGRKIKKKKEILVFSMITSNIVYLYDKKKNYLE